MKDPYFYDDIPVLKNKLGIKDPAELDMIETSITASRILSVETVTYNLPYDFSRLKAIHRYLFSPIYTWAGEVRKVNVEKAEKVLNGLSVSYCDYSMIEGEANKAIKSMNRTDWLKMNLSKRAETYSKKVAALWKIHAFREGNTRTVMTFAAQFANDHGFPLDEPLFKKYASFTRSALVMASIGEYSEYGHLTKIIRNAMIAGQEKKLKKEKAIPSLQQEPDPITEYCRAKYAEKDHRRSTDLER